jgi:hypothetical protein
VRDKFLRGGLELVAAVGAAEKVSLATVDGRAGDMAGVDGHPADHVSSATLLVLL